MAKATPIHNPRVRFTLRFPDGRTQGRQSRFIGWFDDRRWFVDTALHGQPVGTVVENLRQVDRRGRDLPKQPDILIEPDPENPGVEMVPAVNPTQVSRLGAAGRTPVATGGRMQKRPKVLRASRQAQQYADDQGEDVYPGVMPYRPPDPSREVDYDAEEPPEPMGLEVPDPTKVAEPVGEFTPAARQPDRQSGDMVDVPQTGAKVERNVAADDTPPAAPPATPKLAPKTVVRGEPRKDNPPTQAKG